MYVLRSTYGVICETKIIRIEKPKIRHAVSPPHTQDTCGPDMRDPGGRVAAWTMSETAGGDREGQASPSEGASAQDGPELALEPEVIGVAPGKTVAAISPELVYKINRDTQDVCDVPAETTCRR